MPDLWSLLSAPLVELVGWVLLHFVWQGALAVAVLAGALHLLRDHAPTVRYAVSCAALAGLLALPVGTGLLLSESVLGTDSAPAASIVAVEGEAGGTAGPALSAPETDPSDLRALPARVAAWLRPALPWMVMGWALGVLVCSARLAGGAWRVRRLRRTSTSAPAQWQDRLEALAGRMGLGSDVALLISDHVDGPMVAGWWRPVVLVPAGLLSGLPPDQVEALLLHELAHVRRHDVLVGRLQAGVETLLFFHPATWWISRQVRRAREACCDDCTVQAGADRAVYVRALADLAERRLAASPAAGAWAASDGALLSRIRRLLAPTTPSKDPRRLSMAVALLLLVALPLGVVACTSQQSTTTEAEEKAPAAPTETTPPPSAPSDPEEAPEAPAVAVVEDDSTRPAVSVWGDETVEVDHVNGGGYVLRYDGGRVDTIEVPLPEAFVEPDLFGEKRHPPFDPDSLERAILDRIDPDSLKRVLQTRIDPDSIERVVRRRFNPDSLKRRARRMQMRADSLARRLGDPLREKFPSPADSMVVAPGNLGDEAFDVGAKLDSLLQRREAIDVDSLLRRHGPSTDSLRHYFERMRKRWTRETPEELRDQARRLRERAEELEERAEEMETPPDGSR